MKLIRRTRRKISRWRKPPEHPRCVTTRSPEIWNILAKEADITRVATGFEFTEGPVWISSSRSLVFSDIPANAIHELKAGQVSEFRRPSQHANGNTMDSMGRLLTCEHSGRCVNRTEPNGDITKLAERWGDKRLNSPNDLVVKRDGCIYFTDPPFGIKPEQQELEFSGIYRIGTDNSLSLLEVSMPRPNGLAFSNDEKQLFVTDSSLKELRIFDVLKDGSLGSGPEVFSLKNEKSGNPDGMKVDLDGNLFVTGPGGIWVLSPDLQHLGTIHLPEQPSNCAWGEDGRSLFVTAVRSVYKVRCLTRGHMPGEKVG